MSRVMNLQWKLYLGQGLAEGFLRNESRRIFLFIIIKTISYTANHHQNFGGTIVLGQINIFKKKYFTSTYFSPVFQ